MAASIHGDIPRHPPSDSESISSREDDEEWDDVNADDDEIESQEVISLLDDRVFPDVMSMLSHCKEKHGFDFLAVRQKLRLDFHGCVKLVNFIRQRVHEGLTVSEDISISDIDQDQYLKPVLDDDAVILSLFDLPELAPETSTAPSASAEASSEALVNELLQRNSELQEELARATRQFDNYRATVSKTLDERWGDDNDAESSRAAEGKGRCKEDDSKSYWESYAQNDIHETMLKDTIRTDAYRDFIYNNKHLFAGKTVLDIGCGTGILSMFCARAGASRVLAVDASAIIAKAQENVFRNNLSSTITCLHGRIEEVALPVDKVDIIVSEWMGYCLLFEAMLPSVLYARDRYLAPGGLMVPSHTNMSVAPVADPTWVAENGAAFWDDVYGFDMRSMATGLYADARVLHWPPSSICGKPTVFKMLDLYSCSVADLSFTTPYTTSLTHSIEALDGFLIWFDTFFSPSPPSSSDFQPDGPHHVPDAAVAESWILDKDGKRDQDRVAFTTGPWGTETHWKQGLLMIEPPPRSSGSDKKKAAAADADGDAGSLEKDAQVRGEITYSIPADHARGLNIKVSWGQGRSQQWALS